MDGIIRTPGRQSGDVSVWVAEGLDVDALVESHDQRVAEGVLWLGHCVFTGLADDARCRDAGRVPLKSTLLRDVIGRHHLDTVRRAAFEAGYVARDRSYRVGERSQAYWSLPPYDRGPLVLRKIANSGLRHNIRKWRESRRRATWQRIERNETAVDAAVCRHLRRNLRRVRIDTEIDLSEHSHPAYQIAVEHIQGGRLWFTVDDYGRIHTNLTNLPKALRENLLVDDERLTNIDISESQPLFMGMAIAKSMKEPGPRKKANQRESNLGTLHHMLDNTMLDKSTQLEGGFDRERLPDDIRRYLELCEARGLYQTVADRLGKTREEAKQSVMVVFFDKPWHRNAVSAVLDELFPTLMTLMREIKRPDYRQLARFAQRIESMFMFGRVVPRIIDQRPKLFISTIHDSILTTAGDAEFVRGVMRDEFARLGLSPQIQVEPCSDPAGGEKRGRH